MIASIDPAPQVAPGQLAMLENVRFAVGEKADDERLARQLAALCDIFVMDAFGTAHRAQASTHGVARFAPIACAGPLLARELNALQQALLHVGLAAGDVGEDLPGDLLLGGPHGEADGLQVGGPPDVVNLMLGVQEGEPALEGRFGLGVLRQQKNSKIK